MAQSNIDAAFNLASLELTGRQLLCGEYGRVVEVKYYGTSFAATEIGGDMKGKQLDNLLELEFYRNSRTLRHPNVIQFLGVHHSSENTPLLVTEMVQETLTSLLETYPNIPLYAKLSILLDVAKGLWYLHGHNPPIVHGQLSSNSIFLTSQLVAKIGDVGLARIARRHDDSKGAMAMGYTAMDFAAPETVLETQECNPSADVFSYSGIVLHVMNQVWPKPLQDSKLCETKRWQKHLNQIDMHTNTLKQLVETCLQDDPRQRPQMKTVCSRMMSICEPYSGVDRTLWRLDSSADPAVSSGMEKIDVIVHTLNDLERLQSQLEQNNEVITSLRKQLAKEGKPAILNSSGEAIQINWAEEDSLPVERASSTAVLLNGKVYFGGGVIDDIEEKKYSFTISVYDVITNKWDPETIKTSQALFGMTTLDNRLLLAGGITDKRKIIGVDATDKINILVEGVWKHFATLLCPKALLTAVGYKTKLIIVGGQNKLCMPLSAVELLDTVTNQWYMCNKLPQPHYQLLGTIIGEDLYLMGGVGADKSPSKAVFSAPLKAFTSEYQQLEWRYLPCTPNDGSAPVGLYDKFLLAIGGIGAVYYSPDVYILNTTTNVWEILTTIPAARSRPGVVNISNNTLLVMGGGSYEKPTSNTWTGVYH